MINIYSDPHLGLSLASNTTAASRARLQQYMVDHLNLVLKVFDPGLTLCAGDFYHKYQNTEEVLHSSFWAASQTDKILAGNHDVVNIADKKGTLDILDTVFNGQVVPTKFGQSTFTVVQPDDCPDQHVYMVPHHSTQELFVDALTSAKARADRTKGMNILVAHCNYDNPFVRDKITLHLSEREAIWLLKTFDYIVLGHEHTFKLALEDRLVVVGSPHPTGFGDIEDKYTVHIDDDGTLLHNQVWSASANYVECDWREADTKVADSHQWIRLTGEAEPFEMHDLAKRIRSIWKVMSPFAVRSDVKILTGDATRSAHDVLSPDKINEIIEKELQSSPEMYALWKEIFDDQRTTP